jgi:sugar lactone lactonase YvrE
VDEKIISYDAAGKATIITTGIRGDDIVVTHLGDIYVTEPPAENSDVPSKVWLIKPGGGKRVVDTGLRFADGIALSPDQTLLYVGDHRSHWVYSYQIQKDGSLDDKQRFFWLHESDGADDSGAGGMRVDREGQLYVATGMGIQVCDQVGRVQCIIPMPNGKVTNLCFGGEGFDTLFATCGDKVYKRKLKVHGAQAWDAPLKPAAPRL